MVFPVVGGTQDTSYEISNSLRFEGGAATGLARFGNNSRNGNTFTISAWIKRVKLGRTELFNSKVEDSGVNSLVIMFDSNDKLSVIGQPASGTGAGGNRTAALTSAVYRDVSAWYHVVYRQDTTDGTAGNRHRIYVNGVEQTLGTNDALDQNVAFNYFYNASSYPFAIANDERDNSYGSFYIAEHHYTDGVSNGPDAFGKTNANGVWIPKEYKGSHGSYGHYLKFENSGAGSGTTAIGGHDYTTGSSSTIGADSSGNDNHFHVQGYSAEDNTTDTPTNNFATLNPLNIRLGQGLTHSEGNLQVQTGTSSGTLMGASTIAGLKSGKWYAEYKPTVVGTNATMRFGIESSDFHAADGLCNVAASAWASNGNKGRNATDTSHGDSYDDNDIIGVAVDLDNGAIYFSKNGTWQNSSDPESGASKTGAAYTDILTILPDGGYMFAFNFSYNNSQQETVQANFGNPIFSISSGNADGNGYGNFEYAVPDGYYALCTKNLAEYG